MKLFLAANLESFSDRKFFRQVRVACASAVENTTLEPHLLYEGESSDEIVELQNLGVRVVPVDLSIGKQLTAWVSNHVDENRSIARRWAYLRMEITQAITKCGISDEYVLYTDCDVFFRQEVSLEKFRVPVLGAVRMEKIGGYSRFRLGGMSHYNSGVLLVRVSAFAQNEERFREFVLDNGGDTKRPPHKLFQKNLFLSDQVALNLFYRGKFTNLPRTFNWNPQAGVEESAQIIHFNGLKWTHWESFSRNELRADRQEKFEKQVSRNFKSYEAHVTEVLEFERRVFNSNI